MMCPEAGGGKSVNNTTIPFRKHILPAAVCIILQICAGTANGDVLYLKNGEKLRGTVSRNKDTYTIKMPWGKAVFPAKDVERVEKEEPQEYHRKNAYSFLQNRQMGKAWDEYILWKKNGGPQEKLDRFEQDFYFELGLYCLRKGDLSQAEKTATAMRKGDRKDELNRNIAGFSKRVGKLISEGGRYYAQGNMQHAFRKYRQAYILCPEKSGEFKKQYIAAHVHYAQALMREGKYAAAAGIFDAAFSLDPALFRKVKSLWVESKMKIIRDSFEQQRWENCRSIIYNLVDIDSENVQVLMTAGNLSVRLGRYRDAYNYYAEILNRKPKPLGIIPDRTEVDKIREEAGVLAAQGKRAEVGSLSSDASSKYAVYSSPHFSVSAVSAETAQRACTVLEHFYRRIVSRFPSKLELGLWKEPCTVIIMPNRKLFLEKTGFTSEAGVTYLHHDSTTNMYKPVVISHEEAAGLYLSSLAHELGHVVFSYLAKDTSALPLALHEGFAVWAEPDFKHNYYGELLQESIARRRFASLADLLGQKGYPSAWKSRFYAQSYFLVDFLINKIGLKLYIEMVQYAKEHGIFEALFKYTGSIPIDSLEQEWKKYIMSFGRAGSVNRPEGRAVEKIKHGNNL